MKICKQCLSEDSSCCKHVCDMNMLQGPHSFSSLKSHVISCGEVAPMSQLISSKVLLSLQFCVSGCMSGMTIERDVDSLTSRKLPALVPILGSYILRVNMIESWQFVS